MQSTRSATKRYASAVAAIAVATLVRYWGDSVLGGGGFSLMLAAVVIAAWYGGLGPSLVALGLSLAISIAMFGSPPDQPPQPALAVWTGLTVFFFVAVVTALLSESMRAAQRRAEAMADEAIRAEEALRETDRRKDEFLATLAHELRNPLAPISNSLQWLRLQCGESDDSATALAVIERQVRQMVRIVDDLLDVSRITRGRLELRKERIELADVVRTAVETSRPAVEARGHELYIELPDRPVYLEGDLVRLGQVFANLLCNSAKYTEPGGRIRLEATVQAGQAAVAVRDNGIGIAAEALPHIFEMFRQGDGALGSSQGGLGIGLTLVRRLVELHGGSVEAHSDGAARGSEFVVRLPLAESQDGAAAEQAGATPLPLTPPRRVLVVDDNTDSAATLSMMLKVLGSEVRMAHDGLEAVDVASAFMPEIIFMDIGMPNLNGYEATRRIRSMPWGKEMVIVALTGWGQADDVRKSIEAGCTAHVVKPIDLASLGKLMAG